MNLSHLVNKFRRKITRFSGILSQDLDKTARGFIHEVVYGIMASQSGMLNEIGRQLIKPKIWASIHDRVLSMAKARAKENNLLILDLSNLKKKYAEKMEHLASARGR